MGNVLASATKDNTRFTLFENEQVLTADQLNDLFNYLDVQTRLTRTRAIGIGILCGLQIGQLDNKQIVVSKGTALTSDGDLLHIDDDQAFDRYDLFEDNNAKYTYFRVDDQLIPMYVLSSSATSNSGKDMTGFEEATNTVVKDYVGVLYLEDYANDPDLCTGTDCDNKGAEAVREPKILLIHKDNLRVLLQSIPPLNKNYFALEDIAMPRAIIKSSLTQYAELNTAFTNTFSVKTELQEKLVKAYQTCQAILQDEFEGGDPTSEWNQLLDKHFSIGTSIYAQYVYDFAGDLVYAYNEMREALFGDNMLCCPDVALFPKHVLLGTVRTAAATNVSDDSVPASPPVVMAPRVPVNFLSAKLLRIRFDIGSVIKRFHPAVIDVQYRHSFYESPVLNNKEENIERIRFCFMRIHSLIQNFSIPTAETLQNVTQSIKITPGYFNEAPLGKRSLPFYYDINDKLPAHLYWNYYANVRKKENEILSYSSGKYSSKAYVITPLQFNILPYNFFRVEGHIGFTYQEAERVLNDIIVSNNLPINIVSVQIERNVATIPTRPWHFPYLNVHEAFVRNTLNDRMNQVELVNSRMLGQISDTDTTKPTVAVAANSFTNAKNKVFSNGAVTSPNFNINTYKTDVQNAITSVNLFKSNTKQFTFSNTALPHDFVINTDVLSKADIIDDIYKQHIDLKKQDLMLGNYLVKNPGLEHAGGVLRGGTFVLVYTSNDNKVVADFMLPYASVDNDIVSNPVVIKPLPLPNIPQFDVPKLFEQVPTYVKVIDKQLTPIATNLNTITESLNTTITQTKVQIPPIVKLPVFQPGTVFRNFTSLEETTLPVTPATGETRPATDTGGIRETVAGADISDTLANFRNRQDAVAALAADAPDRQQKEQELLTAATALNDQLNKPEVTDNPNNAIIVKSILSDVHASTDLIKSDALKPQAANVTVAANNINKRFNLRP